MSHSSAEQKLVDMSFQLVGTALENYEYFKNRSHAERMEWVAGQLKDCGFPTIPMGISWGVLHSPPVVLEDSDRFVISTPRRPD